MENKNLAVISAILWCAGILLLLGAAFDVLPMADNQAIFLAVACFIINVAVKRVARGGGCCK
ncbi:MAG: hypothetical protein V1828_04180 [Candidatus Omnitrophota bacterium]